MRYDAAALATLVTLWWLCFSTAVGLCLGSFLNAVIYRIPRRRSLRVPLWSACPYCRRRIAWYDNLPILSFILLRGRCRHCGVPISTRYLVVETSTALIVLMLLDAFLIAHARAGLSTSVFGLTDRLAYDWPILLAHVILFACLLAMSAIDLEHYWVDIRFTNLVTVAGFLLHGLWTPRHSLQWPRPSDATAIMSLLAVVGLGLTWLVRACQPNVPLEELGEPSPGPADEAVAPASSHRLPPSLASPSRAAGWAGTLLLAALFVALWTVEAHQTPLRHAPRAIIPLGFFFLLILAASSVEREADHAIVQAIHEERHTARRMVLAEWLWLMPAALAGILGLWLMLRGGPIPQRLGEALHSSIHVPGPALLRNWTPLYGLATAAAGYIIAGAVGWSVRIAFTLLFGKEAFGVGDIHLMAAAGCVAGWPVVVLGFFLTCVVAMIGWILMLPFKRTHALPLGPWLSWSILAVVIFYQAILQWPPLARAVQAFRWILLDVAGPPHPGILP